MGEWKLSHSIQVSTVITCAFACAWLIWHAATITKRVEHLEGEASDRKILIQEMASLKAELKNTRRIVHILEQRILGYPNGIPNHLQSDPG